MITGADMSEKHLLPRIQEDVTESTESISTLGGDGLNFETLEDDLFVDIRASIQRSSKKKSNLTNSSNNTAAIDVDSRAISCKQAGFIPCHINISCLHLHRIWTSLFCFFLCTIRKTPF